MRHLHTGAGSCAVSRKEEGGCSSRFARMTPRDQTDGAGSFWDTLLRVLAYAWGAAAIAHATVSLLGITFV